MNLFAISGLLAALASGAMALLMFWKGRNTLHYLWGIFSVSVMMWGIGAYKIATITNLESAIMWWRIAYIGVIFIPVLFTHFIHKFLNLNHKWFIWIIYFLGFLFLISNLFTDLFIDKVKWVFEEFYYIYPPTPLYNLFFILFIGLVTYSHIRLWLALRVASGIQRSQIKYLFIATSIGFSGGSFSFLPVYNINLYPTLNMTVFLFSPIVTYAMLKYRLMDVRIVIRKTVVYFFSAAFVYGIFYLVVWIYNKLFGSVYTNGAYLLGFIIAPLFVLLFVWFNDKIKAIANKYLFFSLYNYQETINNLSQRLNYLNDLDEIIGLIVDTVKQTMQLDKAGVLLVNQSDGIINYKIAKVIGFNEKNGISLVQDNFLTKYLLEKQKPLIREELTLLARDAKRLEDRDKFTELESNMKRIEASLCIPLMSNKKLIGIVVLGSKISGDAYTIEDLELLNTLSYQAGIAVDNARLYKEIRDLNENLQQKVDEQTKEIREQKEKVEKALEVEKQANEELKRLDENKTDFMLITQHHLRTPLSVNNGFIDLMLNGTFGKVPPKIKDVILRLSESTQKEIDVVNELLDVSSYQIGKEMIHLNKPIDFEALMEETLKDLTAEAESKGIYLKYEKQGEIPKIPADRLKLKLVLTNVIDNCIKYTAKGGVTVTMEVKNDKFLINVTDTGIGLSNEVIQNLFKQSFHRGEQAKKLFAVGKGLGLFLSGKIIEGHHGRIWAESLGDGKGSAFYIELPLKQEINQQIKVENNVNANNK